MTDPTRPEFDLCDSASATSSTLVITPSSGRPYSKSGPIVRQIQKTNNVNRLMNSPQPPRLQKLPSYLQSTMYQPQSTGKGPIQPHISNLPRRKPRQNTTASGALHKQSPTPNKQDAVNSLSSASIRTNAARSPSPPLSSSASSSSSSSSSPSNLKSRGLDRVFVDDEPSPSVAGINIKHTAPIASALEPENVFSVSKGHIQPHITNVPRRRPRRPHLLTRTHTSIEQRRVRDKEAWIKARCLQEVVKGSGIWIAFWDWKKASEDSDSDDEDQIDVAFVEKELCAERVIRVVTRERPDEQSGDGVDMSVGFGQGERKNILELSVPLGVVQTRDDGVPHLSPAQISLARQFLSDMSISSSTNPLPNPTISSTSVPPTPTTSSTPSLSRCSSPSTSPLASTIPSPYPTYPTTPASSSSSTSSEGNKRLMITVPRRECAVDALVLVVLAFCAVGELEFTEVSSASILEFLIRLYDIEGLDHHWRGVLSCDGIEWLDEVLDAVGE
ncbi:hypothetical protein EV361DRAFT_942041 [Lentinula raphanica]|uniref:Uncharacterized protein n=1 Tax=Lentinula raphanica TaxID=153919 RepID=A0AA38UCF7_9AGAR|nr:hypothetical protein F5878DRAFT_230217 [Lentinula raphanica]KAJ3964500.1 hypothetical protein EV361DRAFT_942041 [Lentinula raphanica]